MWLRYDGSEHGPSLIAQISKLADMLANAYELALRSPAAKEPGARGVGRWLGWLVGWRVAGLSGGGVGCLVVLENTPRHHHHLGNEISLKDKDQAGVQLFGAIVP